MTTEPSPSTAEQAEHSAPALPVVMGLSEIAAYYGVRRQAACNWAAPGGDFPEPLAPLAQGRVWRTEDVLAWGQAHGRGAGSGPRPHHARARRKNAAPPADA